ncbi:MAG: hypothetical protein JWN86_2585 [Planctomycetota bacterium]|nr:hypothetical protein [Planctomycetota bacterium]
MDDASYARAEPPNTSQFLLNLRPVTLARAGRAPEAAAAREILATAPGIAARTFAAAVSAVPESGRAEYCEEALKPLRAVSGKDPAFIRSIAFDPDFFSLRTMPAYRDLIRALTDKKSSPKDDR